MVDSDLKILDDTEALIKIWLIYLWPSHYQSHPDDLSDYWDIHDCRPARLFTDFEFGGQRQIKFDVNMGTVFCTFSTHV